MRRPLPQVGGAGALVAAALLGPRLGRLSVAKLDDPCQFYNLKRLKHFTLISF